MGCVADVRVFRCAPVIKKRCLLAYGRHEFTVNSPKADGKTFPTTEQLWELDRVRFLFLVCNEPRPDIGQLIAIPVRTRPSSCRHQDRGEYSVPQRPRFRQSFVARCNGTKEMNYLETCIVNGKFAWNKRGIEDAPDSARAKKKPYKTD